MQQAHIINHGKAYLLARKGLKEGERAERFFKRWGMFLVGAMLVGGLWLWSSAFAGQCYSHADMKQYAEFYYNFSHGQQI